MSELQNPLFDEQKEFLERKKLEYERALRGDVDHIKEQSVVVGKVALVCAGLAGGVWLITKLIGGKKRKRVQQKYVADHSAADNDYEFGTDYYSNSKSKKDKKGKKGDNLAHKSAEESARAFVQYQQYAHEADDLGFGSTASHPDENPSETAAAAPFVAGSTYADEKFEEDPFQDLPYDDSRRLPASQAFDESAPAGCAKKSRSRIVGSVFQAFLQSDTGKVLVAQAAAVALAMVTKKVGEFFPADKNADLATSPGYGTAETGASPVASSAPSDSSDASNPSKSL
ncbi:hypothetical protein [Hymenobacter siberiensis]|uniref:hypothetical protein n=1 Tax=Hymenobacter siberiensis TaxID=2848396 RepID=UPI001C1E2CD8|nr:hypothetical protein [Hymenobacter siberiensis]MBU6119917.1 hypothetical protein [Hymenobacter siberiensis]